MTSVLVEHSGVQFVENDEDILLAALLLISCHKPTQELSRVRYQMKVLKKELNQFMNGIIDCFSFACEPGSFCKSKSDNVPLICICRTPWIEGSTSKAVYREKQKQFNSHRCCTCQGWFHHYCLSMYHVDVPKISQDFICPNCKIPPTIPWHNRKYRNTCTSDNFLNTILIHSMQNPKFLECLGSSEAEHVLKVVIHDFIKSNVESGKTRFLDYVKSIVSGLQYDCFGSEYEQCLQVFKSVWRLELCLECSSPHCPRPKNTRYPNGYNLQPQSLERFSNQIEKQFPENGQALGYCGATFHLYHQKMLHPVIEEI